MRDLKSFIVLLLLFPSWSYAGEIYGTVREHGRPVVNETVTVTCGSESRTSNLDNYGTYRVIMQRTGACSFQIRGLRYNVRSYTSGVRYNFEIVTRDNNQVLRRR